MANAELRELYEADQADRTLRLSAADIRERDRLRRTEVRRHCAAGTLKDGWDHYWAAVVLLHGEAPVDLDDALSLATRAAELEPEPLQIRALVPVAQDRSLLARGQPQWYGTQKLVADGELVLAPINPGAVSDEERRAAGVLTLEERRQEIAQINRLRPEAGVIR